MLLFLIFFPRDRPEERDVYSPFEHKAPRWQDAVIVVGVSVLHCLLVAFISLVWFAYSPDTLQVWANLLGICSATLACIQYLPQIYTTWKLQAVYSLSIPMMCIQTPGSYVFAASLAIRLGVAGWSAWGVYVITGALQGCLLVMAIAFELRDRRQRKAQEDADNEGQSDAADDDGMTNEGVQTQDEGPASEETPLLGAQSPSNGAMTDGKYSTIKKSKLSSVQKADSLS